MNRVGGPRGLQALGSSIIEFASYYMYLFVNPLSYIKLDGLDVPNIRLRSTGPVL